MRAISRRLAGTPQLVRFLSVVILVVLGPLVVRSQATAPGWVTVPAQTVAGQNFILNAVAVPAPGDVWVAGYHWEEVGGAIEYRTLAEHYERTGFAVVPTPDRETAPAADFLEGIAGSSGSDLWAVGASLPPGTPSRTLIEHWDGSSWTIVTSPDPGDLGDSLQAVAAISPTDVWAVGARQNTGTFYQKPMALHWDGMSWAAVVMPNPAGCTGHSSLTGVSAVGQRDVWVAGWCGAGGSRPQQGYVEHWNGSGWAVAAGQGTVPAYSQLDSVAALGPGNVWAVGHTQQPGTSQTVALSVHWDGTRWTSIPVTASGTATSLRAVAGGGGFAPWSVGVGPSPQPPFARPLSARFYQGSWHPAKVPVAHGSLDGAAVDPGSAVWAAGTRLSRQGVNVPLVVMRR